MEKTLGVYHNDYSSLPLARDRKVFPASLLKNLVKFLELKPRELCPLPQDCSHQVFLSLMLVDTQSQAIHQNYHLSVTASL